MKFDIDQPAYVSMRNIVTERTSKIIFWVGSGLSIDANLPGWQKLKEELLKVLRNKAATLAPEDSRKLINVHNDIVTVKDNWLAFQRIKKSLGETSYRDSIRELLRPAASVNIPEIYNMIWRLRIAGLVNLNIDRLATRARQTHIPNSAVTEFPGMRLSSYLHALNSPQPFIVNLHGDYDEYESWVFTKEDLENLKSHHAYKDFIRAVLLTSTVVFIGISVDDEAVGGHLVDLNKISKNTGTHYWITERKDLTTDSWAEKLGVRIIRYDINGQSHTALNALFKDLLTYVPKDEDAPPVEPIEANDIEFVNDSPDELIKLDSEKIRIVLNKKAKHILDDRSPEKYEKYEKFFNDYDQAIHRAWYNSAIEGQNTLLGFRLNKLTARGAFGRVYEATSPTGETVAVKILLEEERRSQNFLQSFRRGVRSMYILSNHKVDGIVEYQEASEIPAMVVMNWIDGPNLDKAVKSKRVDNWNIILKITSQLTNIIENAHRVPERVLHRDLRPPNIMLENFDKPNKNWKVVVLDFDLSWHFGALEQSILHSNTTAGYLAPEQIQKTKYSTRHSAVDSYGLGMTCFFIISSRDPLPAESMHKEWEINVRAASKSIKTTKWLSIPNRFSRIIINSTKFNQAERWDVNQIRSELDRLLEANTKPNTVESAELLAEEIISRTRYADQYVWDSDRLTAILDLANGLRLCLVADESSKRIKININWANKGGTDARNLRKWLEKVSEKVYSLLKKSRWVVETSSKSGQSLNVSGFIDVNRVNTTIDEISKNIESIITAINI